MVNHRSEGDNSVGKPVHQGTENVNLSLENNNSRAADVQTGSPMARIGSLAQVEQFNKSFNPADYSAEDLTKHLDQNQAAIKSQMDYIASLSARMGKANDQSIASKVLDPTGNEFKIENA